MEKYYDEEKFETKQEFINFLVENKKSIIAQKKATLKKADAISTLHYDEKTEAIKENIAFKPKSDEFKVKVVINTTNFMDSHDDVHLKGIWNKSLKQNKMLMHLQEHTMSFDKIISDGEDLKAFTKTFTFNKLGFDLPGETQALIFESKIKKDRNEYMFKQYAGGFVKNHSVGMQYVQIDLAVNDKDQEEEYKVWKAHIDEIANKDLAMEKGYFWAVREAKVIEGSAVPLGSNTITPTIENNVKNQPSEDIDKEPPEGTQMTYEEIRKLFKF